MKYIQSLIILCCLVPCLFAQESGTLTVTSEPAGCWVKIDDVLVGKTPLKVLTLAVGEHDVQVYPPNNGIWNLEEKKYTINVQSNRHLELESEFSSPVFINSTPYGAKLFSDTTHLGVTPIYLPFEPNKNKLFLLKKAGFKDYEFYLKSSESVFAEMEKDDNYEAENNKPHLLGMIPKRHVKSKFSLLALTVATHWASFYFKNRADKNFDNYSNTGNAELRDQYWNDVKKFDRLSEITLGVSYASLAGLIYMVVWK